MGVRRMARRPSDFLHFALVPLLKFQKMQLKIFQLSFFFSHVYDGTYPVAYGSAFCSRLETVT
jgi:hypothetical protein